METPLPHRISEHWAKHFAASTRWRPPAPGSIRPPGNRRRIRRCAPDGAPRWARSGPHPRGGRKISGVNPSTSATSTTLPFRLTPPSADYDLQGSEPSERRPHHDQPVRTVHSANHPPTPQGKHNPSTTPPGRPRDQRGEPLHVGNINARRPSSSLLHPSAATQSRCVSQRRPHQNTPRSTV